MPATSKKITGKLDMAIMQGLFMAGAVVTFALVVVAPLLGPSGLGLLPQSWVGLPSVTATLTDPGTASALPPPAAGPRSFEFTTPITAQVQVLASAAHSAPAMLLMAAQVASGLVAVGVLLAAFWLARSLRNGDPFGRSGFRAMLATGLLVSFGGLLAEACSFFGTATLLASDGVEPHTAVAAEFSFLPLFAGIFLILVAEVFRRGAILRADTEGLV